MTKLKNCSVSDLFDRILWSLIMLFPLIAYCLYLVSDKGTSDMLGIVEYYTDIIPLNMAGTIFETLHTLFVEYMPFFSSMSWVCLIFTWFVFVEFVHIVVDILVFIPRMCHYWISCFGGKLQ